VSLPGDAESLVVEWLGSIEAELDRPDCDRDELCRRILTEIWYPQYVDSDTTGLPLTVQVALRQLDPRNVTLEPEYYREIDRERYARVKPLIWLWEMFDKSAMGENVDLGVRFRRILAKRIFKKCGKNFKAFHFVKLSFGYNLEVGDDVVVHRHVLLDDRGGIRIENKASLSDWVNIYSHSHDIVDPAVISTPETVIGEGVRITYHATVLAGVHVADDSMIGAMALATKDTVPHTVSVGIPARVVKVKPAEQRRARAAGTSTADPLVDPELELDVDPEKAP